MAQEKPTRQRDIRAALKRTKGMSPEDRAAAIADVIKGEDN